MEKLMEKLKKYWGWITLSVAILTAIFGCFLKVFNYFDGQNEEMAKTIQMAEKSIIWNDKIPVIERANVCDDYLARGYNSYTKKLCENVILQDERLAMSDEESDFILGGS